MVGTRCTAPECTYVTEDGSPAEKIELMRLQIQVAHPSGQNMDSNSTQCKAKLDPPRLAAGSSQEIWDIFLKSWNQYKKAMKIVQNSSFFLLSCLDDDVRQDVYRAHPDPDEVDEQTLLESIKSLSVVIESKLVHRIKMTSTTQSPGSSVRQYLTTLKGTAKHCKYSLKCPHCSPEVDYSQQMIKDQIIKGLSDRDIIADLLGDTKTDRQLDEVIEFIDRKEKGKAEHGRVTGEATAAIKRQNNRGSG